MPIHLMTSPLQLCISAAKGAPLPSTETLAQKLMKGQKDQSPDTGYAVWLSFKSRLKSHVYAGKSIYDHIKHDVSGGQNFFKNLKTSLGCDRGRPAQYRQFKKTQKSLDHAQATTLALLTEAKAEANAIKKDAIKEKDKALNWLNAKRSETTAEAAKKIREAQEEAQTIVSEATTKATVIKDQATKEEQRAQHMAKALLDEAHDQIAEWVKNLDFSNDHGDVVNQFTAESKPVTFNVNNKLYTLPIGTCNLYDDFIKGATSSIMRGTVDAQGHIILTLFTPEEMQALVDFRTGDLQQIDHTIGLIAGKKACCQPMIDYFNLDSWNLFEKEITNAILKLQANRSYHNHRITERQAVALLREVKEDLINGLNVFKKGDNTLLEHNALTSMIKSLWSGNYEEHCKIIGITFDIDSDWIHVSDRILDIPRWNQFVSTSVLELRKFQEEVHLLSKDKIKPKDLISV